MDIRTAKTAALLGLLLTLAPAAWAQDSDKLDIKKLEDKYWAAKDDDFSVVQNRAFPKEKRIYGTLLYGTPINDAYETGSAMGLAVGYYFTERYGIEVTHITTDYDTNDMTTQFVEERGVHPNYNSLKSQTSLQFNWVPLYAKMSFLDKKIVYFDMGLGAILGTTNFRQNIDPLQGANRSGSEMHYGFSLYQHFFLTEHMAVKFDYRSTWTNEERFRYRLPASATEAERSIGKKSINDTTLLLGLTFFW